MGWSPEPPCGCAYKYARQMSFFDVDDTHLTNANMNSNNSVAIVWTSTFFLLIFVNEQQRTGKVILSIQLSVSCRNQLLLFARTRSSRKTTTCVCHLIQLDNWCGVSAGTFQFRWYSRVESFVIRFYLSQSIVVFVRIIDQSGTVVSSHSSRMHV